MYVRLQIKIMVKENMWKLYNKAMDLQKWLSGPEGIQESDKQQPNGPAYITWLVSILFK